MAYLAVAKLCGINDPEELDKFCKEAEKQEKTLRNESNCPCLQFLSDIGQARIISRAIRAAMPGTSNAIFILNTKLQQDTVGVVPYSGIPNLCKQLGLDPQDPLKWASEKSTTSFPCIVYYQRPDKKTVAMQFRLPFVNMANVNRLIQSTGVTEEGAIMKELLETFAASELLLKKTTSSS